MRDVQLWWQLHDAPGPELVESLDQLAALSIRERAPVRNTKEMPASLSVRATEETCIYLAHPLIGGDGTAIPDILKSSFCGRFSGRWDDISSDAGAVWSIVADRGHPRDFVREGPAVAERLHGSRTEIAIGL